MYQRLVSILDPNTRRRLRRFGKIKRAKWSLIILTALFIISLFSNFIANEKPLLVRVNGKLLIPSLKFYSDDALTGSGNLNRARFKELHKSPLFTDNKGNWMLWPMLPYGSREALRAEDIEIDKTLTLRFIKEARVATLDIDSSFNIQRSRGAAGFYNGTSDRDLRRTPVETETIVLPNEIKAAITKQFANQATSEIERVAKGIAFSLSEFTPRSRAPKLARLTLRESASETEAEDAVMLDDFSFEKAPPAIWSKLSDSDREKVTDLAKQSLEVQTEPIQIDSSAGKLRVICDRETVSFPYPPTKGHALGLDESGRDVLVLILYATRIGLLFGICLVILTFTIGISLGAIQGYFGDKVDLLGQRFTEIWSALPFLYIMIMLSNRFGKGFFLLLFIYAIFNWVGISMYMRAEFLKLRKQPFVESARVMGINRWKIIFKTILPNALVPVIALFPFELVGAIFSLTALDFLGFGLPVGTPSWGDLLNQAKTYPYGWWLVLFPSLALFIVSLLGIFVGEGVRAAFDPKTESKME